MDFRVHERVTLLLSSANTGAKSVSVLQRHTLSMRQAIEFPPSLQTQIPDEEIDLTPEDSDRISAARHIAPEELNLNPRAFGLDDRWRCRISPLVLKHGLYGEMTIRWELHEFKRFQRLPKDIRIMIWELALPGPRIVGVRAREIRDSRQEGTAGKSAKWGLMSECEPPAVLFVNHESYDFASARYTKAFGASGTTPQTWFDFKRDTLFLDGCIQKLLAEDVLQPHSFGEDASRVENLAMIRPYHPSATSSFTHPHRMDLDSDDLEWMSAMLSWFGGIKNLTVTSTCERSLSKQPTLEFMDISKALMLENRYVLESDMGTLLEDNFFALDYSIQQNKVNVFTKQMIHDRVSESSGKDAIALAQFRQSLQDSPTRIDEFNHRYSCRLDPPTLDWALPRLNRNIVVSGERRARMLKLERAYEDSKSRFAARVGIRVSRDSAPYWFRVSPFTAARRLGDALLRRCGLHLIDASVSVKLFLGDGLVQVEARPEIPILECEGIADGAVLEARFIAKGVC